MMERSAPSGFVLGAAGNGEGKEEKEEKGRPDERPRKQKLGRRIGRKREKLHSHLKNQREEKEIKHRT